MMSDSSTDTAQLVQNESPMSEVVLGGAVLDSEAAAASFVKGLKHKKAVKGLIGVSVFVGLLVLALGISVIIYTNVFVEERSWRWNLEHTIHGVWAGLAAVVAGAFGLAFISRSRGKNRCCLGTYLLVTVAALVGMGFVMSVNLEGVSDDHNEIERSRRWDERYAEFNQRLAAWEQKEERRRLGTTTPRSRYSYEYRSRHNGKPDMPCCRYDGPPIGQIRVMIMLQLCLGLLAAVHFISTVIALGLLGHGWYKTWSRNGSSLFNGNQKPYWYCLCGCCGLTGSINLAYSAQGHSDMLDSMKQQLVGARTVAGRVGTSGDGEEDAVSKTMAPPAYDERSAPPPTV